MDPARAVTHCDLVKSLSTSSDITSVECERGMDDLSTFCDGGGANAPIRGNQDNYEEPYESTSASGPEEIPPPPEDEEDEARATRSGLHPDRRFSNRDPGYPRYPIAEARTF